MKTTDSKPASAATKASSPFFSKDSEQGFFGSSAKEKPFFASNSGPARIQAKLTIGRPGDIYEKEADAMADKVVQRLAEPSVAPVRTETPSTVITPFVQAKCAACEQEEKLQKKEKEEEKEQPKEELRKKPIFDNHAEPPDDEKHKGDQAIQRKCAGCKEEEKVQKKPIFESKEEQVGDVKNIQHKCAECEKEEKLQKKAEAEKKEEEPAGPQPVQKKCAGCKDEEKVQKASSSISSAPATGPSIESRLASGKGQGSPMPAPVRSRMETSFGADFGNVRIHTGSHAAQMNKDLGAHAFTHGSDIYFNSGKYETNSPSGNNLLAHELTHTLQQGNTRQTHTGSPAVRARAKENSIHCLSNQESGELGKKVFHALDGWTSSKDSADILAAFKGLARGDVNGVLNATALYATKSVKEIYGWMKSDMVTSDWKALANKFIAVGSEDISEVIAVEVHGLLTGLWVSENDSKEVLDYLQGGAGNSLDDILTSLETKSGKDLEATATFLLGSVKPLDSETLAGYFFNSSGVRAFKYASYWYASKIYDLLTGYTSVGDSKAIVQNFSRVKIKSFQIAVYSKLSDLASGKWKDDVSCVLMDTLQQEDYNKIQVMLPEQLPVYCLERNWLKKGWNKIENGFDYVAGAIEFSICSIAGTVAGIFDAAVSIVSGLVDIAYGIKNLIGWVISKWSDGKFARESEENVNNFFKSIGTALKAPGKLISQMWEKTKQEASLIEGPLEDCQQAIFWMRRIANFAVNIVLLLFAGYGAVKAALEAIETIKTISTFGQFVAKVGEIPVAVLRKIKSIPASLASGGSKIISTIRNVDEIISAVRSSIGVIKLAVDDENFWLNLRKAAGDFASDKIQTEKDWWKKKRENWKSTTSAEEVNLNKSEEMVDTATAQADADPATAEQQSGKAEEQAKASKTTIDETQKEVESGKDTPLSTAEKELPGAFVEESCSLGSLICPKGVPYFVRKKIGPYPNPKRVPYPGGKLILRGLTDEGYLEVRKITGKSLRKLYLNNPDVWSPEFEAAYNARKAQFPKGDPEKWWPVEDGRRWQTHHREPLDFGGDNSPKNLVALEPSLHSEYTNYWNALKREIGTYFSENEWRKIIGGDRNRIFLPEDFE